MKSAASPRHQLCPNIQKYVNVAGNESRCRDEHGCDSPDCPLTKEFGEQVLDLRMLAYGSIAGVWPVPDNNRE